MFISISVLVQNKNINIIMKFLENLIDQNK